MTKTQSFHIRGMNDFRAGGKGPFIKTQHTLIMIRMRSHKTICGIRNEKSKEREVQE